jgi:hypothetical protein
MRTLQLYATGSATGNAIASVVIPSATRIKQIQIAFDVDSITDNADVTLEFSKVPTTQIATNGAQDPFLEVRLKSNFVTSGLTTTGVNQSFPVDVECRQGELIYVHAAVTGTATYRINAILWF